MKAGLKSKIIPLIIYTGIVLCGGIIAFTFEKSMFLRLCFLAFILMGIIHIIYFHYFYHIHESRIKEEKNKIKSIYETLLARNQVLELNNEALKVLLEVRKFIIFSKDVSSNLTRISQICNEKLNFKTGIFLLKSEKKDLHMEISPFFEYNVSIQRNLFCAMHPHLWDVIYTEEDLLIDNFFKILKVPLEKEMNNYSCLCIPIKVDGSIVGVSTFVFDGSLEGFSELIINLAPLLNEEFGNAIKYSRKYIELLEKAEKDELTGLYNYAYFRMKLLTMFKENLKHDTPFGLLMIDVNNFKNINDTKGHLYGNKILKEIASSINNSIRCKDIACRYGGDEFVVLIPEVDLNNINDIALRIITNIRENENIPSEIGVSIGGTTTSALIKNVDQLLEKADAALYKAKNIKEAKKMKFILDVV